MRREPALVLTPQPPWPLDDGGRIGLHQFTVSVARSWATTLLTMCRPGEMLAPASPQLAELGVRVECVPYTPPVTAMAALAGTFGRWPYTLARYRSRTFDSAIRAAVDRDRPELVMINHLHLATYADSLGGAARVLRQHNVESLWLERYANSLRGPSREFALFQARRMRSAEGRLCSAMDLVLAIHDDEAAAIRALAPDARVEVVPVGVDFARFRDSAPGAPPVVLVAGSFNWPPNDEGARAFLAEGWPRIRARVPDARLRLVGKGMSDSLVAFAREAGAEPVGYVADIAAEYAAASALVVPLWAGAGMRVKIVEAMAARLPVVATSLAAEGLEVRCGVEAEIGETPTALADAAAGLLAGPERARAMADAAHAHAAIRWSLDAVAGRTQVLCEAAVKRRRDARGGDAT